MSLEDLISKQEIVNDEISKVMRNYTKTAVARRTKGFITERLADIKLRWNKFNDNHEQICRLARSLTEEARKKFKYLTEDTYSELEIKYFEFIGMLRDTLNSFESSPSTQNNESVSNNNHSVDQSIGLRLPTITLPKFSGSYDAWRSFHDLFDSLVHNNAALQPVQKFHYLKSSVTGEAEHLIRQFPMTNASYDNAWKVLVERYNNKRVLVNTQLKNLFNISKLNTESAKGIKSLLDKSSEAVFELEALGVSTKEWDPVLIYLLVSRLPAESHRLWEQELSSSTDLPTYKQFKEFLESRFRTLEAIAEAKTHHANDSTNKSRLLNHFSSSLNKCVVCNESHSIYKCPVFSKYNVDKKYNVVSSKRLCSNCLSNKHKIQDCTSKYRCQKCGKRHHSLLHKSNNALNEKYKNTQNHNSNAPVCTKPQPSPSTSSDNEKMTQSFHANRKIRTQALLSTALVNVTSKKGTVYTLRALIDSGSQVSFITKSAAQMLQLKQTNTSIQVTGLGKSQVANVRKQSRLEIQSQYSPKSVEFEALIVPNISNLIPPSSIPVKTWEHISNLQLADPVFYKPAKIDLLLGADVYSQIILEGIRKGPKDTPSAQNSTLGWILFGSFPINQNQKQQAKSFGIQIINANIISSNFSVRKSWQYKRANIKKKSSRLNNNNPWWHRPKWKNPNSNKGDVGNKGQQSFPNKMVTGENYRNTHRITLHYIKNKKWNDKKTNYKIMSIT